VIGARCNSILLRDTAGYEELTGASTHSGGTPYGYPFQSESTPPCPLQ